MAAGGADASHRITALTEDEGRAAAATREALGSAGPLPRAQRERSEEREEAEEELRQEVQCSTKECVVCGALCGSQEKLRLHALSHAVGDKPFHCSQPHCCKAFSSKYKLFR